MIIDMPSDARLVHYESKLLAVVADNERQMLIHFPFLLPSEGFVEPAVDCDGTGVVLGLVATTVDIDPDPDRPGEVVVVSSTGLHLLRSKQFVLRSTRAMGEHQDES